MKHLISKILIVACLGIVFSCGPKGETDSKEIAEDQNDEKFDKSKDADAYPALEKDAEFAVKVADGGLLEVRLGELAQSNAASPDVKKFGQRMITDHGKANEELKALAQQKNISLPATLSNKNQEKYDDLAKKTGVEFDKAYCNLMVKDHKDDIDEFKKQADKGNDPELKSWASEKLPTLENHLTMIESMQDVIKKTSNK